MILSTIGAICIIASYQPPEKGEDITYTKHTLTNYTECPKVSTKGYSKAKEIKEETKEKAKENTKESTYLTRNKGVHYNNNGNRETYYNLDMSGVVARAKNEFGLSGSYWVRDDGCKMFGDYIIVAANLSVYSRGSIVQTSLGKGIVLDTGGFAKNNIYGFDIATNW